MKTIGMTELKAHLSAVLREVQEQGELINITCRGKVVARIVPVSTEGARATIADLNSLRAEIGRLWTPGVSVPDMIDDIRR